MKDNNILKLIKEYKVFIKKDKGEYINRALNSEQVITYLEIVLKTNGYINAKVLAPKRVKKLKPYDKKSELNEDNSTFLEEKILNEATIFMFQSYEKELKEISAKLGYNTNSTEIYVYIYISLCYVIIEKSKLFFIDEISIEGYLIILNIKVRIIRKVADIISINDDLNTEKKELFFRGHANIVYNAIPTVFRDDNLKNEYNFINEIIRYCPDEFTGYDNDLDYLVKMQHYGLPTRMLDLTSNALVALYFACLNEKVDGEILVFEEEKVNIKSPRDEITKIFTRLPRLTYIELSNLKEGILSDYAKLKIDPENNYKVNEILNMIENETIFVKPNMTNNRILKQSGSFLLFGLNDFIKDEDLEVPNYNYDRLVHKSRIKLKKQGNLKYIIPYSYKIEILSNLDFLNINERTLFPEIEHVSKHLKENFK